MSDYPMLISNKLHSFRNFYKQILPRLVRLFIVISINLKQQIMEKKVKSKKN